MLHSLVVTLAIGSLPNDMAGPPPAFRPLVARELIRIGMTEKQVDSLLPPEEIGGRFTVGKKGFHKYYARSGLDVIFVNDKVYRITEKRFLPRVRE